jgi:hypothetical protein
MEVLDIGLSEFEPPMNIRFSDENQSASSQNSPSFGMGIEMLMNEKHRGGGGSSKIDMGLGELDKLESELNDMGDNNDETRYDSGGSGKMMSGISNMFGFGSDTSDHNVETIKITHDDDSDSRIGHATAESVSGTNRTWDGYHKATEVPLSGTNGHIHVNERERRRKKRAMIKKLDEWTEKGHLKNGSRFDMESPYDEIEDEFESAMNDKRRSDAVKMQGWWYMGIVNTIEYANTRFNPFDLNLDGWGEKISEDMDDYDEIFEELYDKYNGLKLSPELSIIMRLCVSAAVVAITNQSFSSAAPGVNDIMKQNPDILKMFQNAVASSMAGQNPLFDMANNMSKKEPRPNENYGPPPSPVATQGSNSQPHSQARPGMTYTQTSGNRPDISASRGGAMFREEGIDMTNQDQNKINQEQYQQQQQMQQQMQMQQQHMQQQQQQQQHMQHKQQQIQRQQQQQPYGDVGSRPEMKGPQHNVDINNILAGLKTRTSDININDSTFSTNDNDSMISVDRLDDMNNTAVPKRATNKRKQKSDKNTIAFDI